MRCIWRSPLCLCIGWTCGLILVFAYIFFDLLDIDGSNLRAQMAGSKAAEERIVEEDAGKHMPTGFVGPWLPSQRSLSSALSRFRISLSPTSKGAHPSFLLLCPRSLITTQQTSTIQPEGDPSRRTV